MNKAFDALFGGGGVGLGLGPDGITPSIGVGVGGARAWTNQGQAQSAAGETIDIEPNEPPAKGQPKAQTSTAEQPGLEDRLTQKAASGFSRRTSRPSAKQKNSFIDKLWNFLQKVLEFVADILSIIPRFIHWLFTSPYVLMLGAIASAILSIYFFGVNLEGWRNSAASFDVFFMPKPFINDGAVLTNLWPLFGTGLFWLAFAISACIQMYQSFVWAGMAQQAQSDRNLAMRGGAVLVAAIVLDLVIAHASYPVWGVGPGQQMTNLFWLAAAVMGADVCGAVTLILIGMFLRQVKK